MMYNFIGFPVVNEDFTKVMRKTSCAVTSQLSKRRLKVYVEATSNNKIISMESEIVIFCSLHAVNWRPDIFGHPADENKVGTFLAKSCGLDLRYALLVFVFNFNPVLILVALLNIYFKGPHLHVYNQEKLY